MLLPSHYSLTDSRDGGASETGRETVYGVRQYLSYLSLWKKYSSIQREEWERLMGEQECSKLNIYTCEMDVSDKFQKIIFMKFIHF